MQLPEAAKRELAYAAAAVIAISGMGYALSSSTSRHQRPGDAAVAYAGASDSAGDESAGERPKVTEYTVAEGDTIQKIAEQFGLKVDTVLWANGLSANSILTIGQTIRIPAEDGVLYQVRRGDNLWSIAIRHGSTEAAVLAANQDLNPAALQPGDLVLVPGGKPAPVMQVAYNRNATSTSRSGSTSTRSSSTTADTGNYQRFPLWPASGRITDTFGWRTHPIYGTRQYHSGVDIAMSTGTAIRAVQTGVVLSAGRDGGYGLAVSIDHGGGLVTKYAHMSKISVSAGQLVEAGEVIGYSGNTGVSTGPHLHFMVIVNGSNSNPLSWLP